MKELLIPTEVNRFLEGKGCTGSLFSLNREKLFLLSDDSSQGHRHSLLDRSARFHHTIFGIVRPRTWRKMLAFEVRCLWP